MTRELSQRKPVRRVIHRGKIILYDDLPVAATAPAVIEKAAEPAPTPTPTPAPTPAPAEPVGSTPPITVTTGAAPTGDAATDAFAVETDATRGAAPANEIPGASAGAPGSEQAPATEPAASGDAGEAAARANDEQPVTEPAPVATEQAPAAAQPTGNAPTPAPAPTGKRRGRGRPPRKG